MSATTVASGPVSTSLRRGELGRGVGGSDRRLGGVVGAGWLAKVEGFGRGVVGRGRRGEGFGGKETVVADSGFDG